MVRHVRGRAGSTAPKGNFFVSISRPFFRRFLVWYSHSTPFGTVRKLLWKSGLKSRVVRYCCWTEVSPLHENGYNFPMAPLPETRPDSTSSCVLLRYVNQRDDNLLSDSLGVATEGVNRRIRQGIILQARQIALFNSRGGLDISQTQPESFTGGFEGRTASFSMICRAFIRRPRAIRCMLAVQS